MAWKLGAIVADMVIDTKKWSAAIKTVEKDQKSLRDWSEKSKKSFLALGTGMTIAGGLITGALGLMVKKASDAEETTAKFGTVFQSVFDRANQSAKDLADNYGLSANGAKTMLAATGDLLTGLGVSADTALDLSTKTQQLAVDLASFTNYSGGATGASEALTKAMLGERESIKSLGIVITEEMIKEKLLEMGMGDLSGQALYAAKAQATLAIAYSQSKNAVGDFARTSDSFANQSRVLQARLSDLTVTIGNQLLPIATKIVGEIGKIVSKMSEWTQKHPGLTSALVKLVAVAGGLMTVFGPILIILPKLVLGFDTMRRILPALVPNFKSLGQNANLLHGTLGKLGAAAGAAFVGWEIGRLIGQVTGLDKVVEGLFTKIIDKLGLFKAQAELADDRTGILARRQELLAEASEKAGTQIGSVNDAVKIMSGQFEMIEGHLVKVATVTAAAGTAQRDYGELLKKYSLETAEQASAKIKTLTQDKKDLKAALDEGKISLGAYKSGVKEIDDELGKLTGTTKGAKVETQSWTDYIKGIGITTLKEKKDRVAELEGILKSLDAAYKAGKLTLGEYITATQAAKRELEGLSVSMTAQALPAARNFNSIIAQAPSLMQSATYVAASLEDQIKGIGDKMGVSAATVQIGLWNMRADFLATMGIIVPKIEELAPATVETTSTMGGAFDGLFNDIATGMGNLLQTYLEGGSTLKELTKGILGEIKSAFFRTFAQEITGMLVKFAKGAIGTLGSIGSSATSTIGSAFKSVAGTASGIGSTLTGILPAVGAIGSAIGGIAGVLSLLKGPEKQTDVTYWLKLMNDHEQVLENLAKDDTAQLNDIKTTLWISSDFLSGILGKLGDVQGTIDSSAGWLGDRIASAIGDIGSAQKGAVVKSAALMAVHGTPSRPEIIAPLDDFGRLIRTGGGEGGRQVVQNIEFKPEINLNGTIIADREFTRDRLLPEIIEAFEANVDGLKSKMAQALGMEA